MAVAARVGKARLIDNVVINPDKTHRHQTFATKSLIKPAEYEQRRRAMQRQMLKSKIHRATVTGCDVDYVGSITIDPELMRAADLHPQRAGARLGRDQRLAVRHLRDRGRAGQSARCR